MSGLTKQAIEQPYYVDSGTLVRRFHPGQWAATDSRARFVVVLAGTQGGKTSYGPFWLYDEVERCGPGDYLVVTPTYPLLKLKALPVFLNLFENLLNLGKYYKADKVFEFDALGEIRTWGKEQEVSTRIIFGHAQDPESLESATAKAAWLDEAGQNKFKLPSWEAIIRRLSLAQGRVLITTTPYNLGWLKQQLWDERDRDPDIEVIRFDSTENPAFPQAEMDRIKRLVDKGRYPEWKFKMFYKAIFTRPAGMIYDNFNDEINVIDPITIPESWPKYLGLDFGGVNTAAVFLAKDPKSKLFYLYREYLTGGKTAAEHADSLLKGEKGNPVCYGGAKSEGQWRNEFNAAGLIIRTPPVSDVEVGINRGYSLIPSLRIFSTCAGVLDEIGTYSRELDDAGEPTERIADKETFHRLDAYRYIASYLSKGTEGGKLPKQPKKKSRWTGTNAGGRGNSKWKL